MPEKVDLWQRYHKSIPSGLLPPIITNVAISSTGLVTWTTNIAATSQVLYGGTPHLGLLSAFDSDLATSHSVQLPGLVNGLYYVRVQSTVSGFLTISDLYTFTYTDIATVFFLQEDGSSFILLEDGVSKLGLED